MGLPVQCICAMQVRKCRSGASRTREIRWLLLQEYISGSSLSQNHFCAKTWFYQHSMTGKLNLKPAGVRHIPTLLHPGWTGDNSTTDSMRRHGGTVDTMPALSIFNNQLCTAKSLLTWVTLIRHLNKKEEENNWKVTGTSQASQSMSTEPTCSRDSSLERQH